MPLVIKDPESIAIIQKLAERRKTSAVEVLRQALLNEWESEAKEWEMRDEIEAFQAKFGSTTDSPGRNSP